ncbi:MAG: 5-formaminoimidazole-4-carboxamide-(beta)-D-ribofuranosyl 5-monophosphate synthetase-like protein [Candidatus Peribacteria bacterium]|nr:5-formaminoimidazole-4-carboxamide-(beta)-D-ribofuranosyl 5-monophosphate synthetase-like protein [Candidatus Peribacteria bacterium]
MDIAELLSGYDRTNLTVGTLGGHSALDITHGAKKYGFHTLAVAAKGRDQTYVKYYKTRQNRGCIDEVISVNEFQDILSISSQEMLRKKNTIFVHNRYTSVYLFDHCQLESDFHVPVFGSRHLICLESSAEPFNQYDLLQKAGIRVPRHFDKPEDVNGQLAIVKAAEAERSYERAFFLISDHTSWLKEGSRLEVEGKIAKGWESSPIEEFIVGAPVNFNFFYSPLTGELELMGTDILRQTNLDGFLHMTSDQQLKVLDYVDVKMIETGQMAVTVKESLLEKAFDIGERFVKATQSLPPTIDPGGRGIIGPFALQGAVVTEKGQEDIIIYDVSFRMPGAPGIIATPYSAYLHGEPMSMGERIGMELRDALSANALEKVIT